MAYLYFSFQATYSDSFVKQHFVKTGEVLSTKDRYFDIQAQELSSDARARLVDLCQSPLIYGNKIPITWDSFEAPTVEQSELLIAEWAQKLDAKRQDASDFYLKVVEQSALGFAEWEWAEKYSSWSYSVRVNFDRYLPKSQADKLGSLFEQWQNWKDAQAKAQDEAEKQADLAAKAAKIQERIDWAEAHGSEHLKASLAAGYDCKTLYLEERLNHDYPGFEYFDGRLKDRSCPSPEALALSLSIPGSRVHWYAECHRECEVVAIENYLGEYTIGQFLFEPTPSTDDYDECLDYPDADEEIELDD